MMRHKVDPRQPHNGLFDPYRALFAPATYQRVLEGWQGVFRHVILELLPADRLGEHFDPCLGRPTKELYGMAGLVLIKEFHNWTTQQAAEAYTFHLDVQYALNLEPGHQTLSERTIDRYLRLFREDELAQSVLHDVTVRLAERLELKTEQQRLDSTQVLSDMATFGRTRLMGVTIKRFLTQVKRHALASYEALPEVLRQRYAPGEHQLLAGAKDSDSRARLRQQVAEDMHLLVERFADDPVMVGRSSYQALVRVFEQQCTVVGDKVTVTAKTGGACVQNPSDPDATYDGKKGPGYKVQLTETCHPDNEVQLITAALPQTAADSDAHALVPILADLQDQGLLPEEMLCDTAYGSDDNVQQAAQLGVELVSPVAGPEQDADRLNADDFPINDETHAAESCPAGRIPLQTVHDADKDKTTVHMSEEDCRTCPHQDECPVTDKGDHFEATFTNKDRRLDERRREQATPPFRERYARRAGIESTNSGLKRRLGLKRLRVRGRVAVFHALRLKIAGWNILRAAASAKLRQIVAERAARAVPGTVPCLFGLLGAVQRLRPGSERFDQPWTADPPLALAA